MSVLIVTSIFKRSIWVCKNSQGCDFRWGLPNNKIHAMLRWNKSKSNMGSFTLTFQKDEVGEVV